MMIPPLAESEAETGVHRLPSILITGCSSGIGYHAAHTLQRLGWQVFAAVGVYQLVKKRWADAAWTGGAITLPMTTGLSGGMPRFLMVVYPVYFALAEGSRGRPRARLVWWILSGGMLLAAAARFVNWHWVA